MNLILMDSADFNCQTKNRCFQLFWPNSVITQKSAETRLHNFLLTFMATVETLSEDMPFWIKKLLVFMHSLTVRSANLCETIFLSPVIKQRHLL